MAAGFHDLNSLCGVMLAAPSGVFMVTKTEQWKFKVTETETDLEFKVTQNEMFEMEVTE